MRTAHLAEFDSPHSGTLCGEPWETWQAPDTAKLVRELEEELAKPPEETPPPDWPGHFGGGSTWRYRLGMRANLKYLKGLQAGRVRQCQACLKIVTRGGFANER